MKPEISPMIDLEKRCLFSLSYDHGSPGNSNTHKNEDSVNYHADSWRRVYSATLPRTSVRFLLADGVVVVWAAFSSPHPPPPGVKSTNTS